MNMRISYALLGCLMVASVILVGCTRNAAVNVSSSTQQNDQVVPQINDESSAPASGDSTTTDADVELKNLDSTMSEVNPDDFEANTLTDTQVGVE